MHASAKKLANCTSYEEIIRSGLVRCGFELEFQAVAGAEPTARDFSAQARRQVREACSCDIVHQIDGAAGELVAAGYDICNLHDDLIERLPHRRLQFVLQFDTEVRRVERSLAENEQDDDGYDPDSIVTAYRSELDFKTDSSVRGGEITTEGPRTIEDFLRISGDLLNNNHFEVDTGCSYHIHVSIDGVKHTYGWRFQTEMMAYLIENRRHLPQAVRKRWSSNPGKKYAGFKVTTEKYSAIHRHPYRTWEFRLFGNINKAAEGAACLKQAVLALQHAYKVQAGLTESLITGISQEEVSDICYKALSSRRKFTTVLRQHLEQSQSAAA